MNVNFEQFIDYLEKIVKKEEPLRQPPISIIHCPVDITRDFYIDFINKLKKIKVKHRQWNYYLFNMEQKMFEILDELEYTDGDKYALSCSREELEKDMKASVLPELVNKLETEIDMIIKRNSEKDYPPFLVLLNIHGCYNYIQTKDIIARIINKRNILILIIYLDEGISKSDPDEDETYKLTNYNVHSIYIKTEM